MKFINEAVSIDYCPFCRTSANMNVIVTSRAIADENGGMKKIITKTYHCESCGSFVHNIDEAEETPATAA